MGAATVETVRRFPHAPEALCRLVGDVESYPRFIPWVKSLAVENRVQNGEGWEGLARAVVGWRSITERFATFVRCAPEAGEVDVRLAQGPFSRLENRWRFRPARDGAPGSDVHFWIEYEFKNPMLQAVASLNRDLAADRIVAAFAAEADRRFAPARKA